MAQEFTAEGGHGAVPVTDVPAGAGPDQVVRSGWPLYEVFLRGRRGLNHVHVGSLHAADAEMALHHARDLYTRRNEGVSIWAVRSSDIVASSPGDREPLFDPANSKVYRHPTFFPMPDEVKHI